MKALLKRIAVLAAVSLALCMAIAPSARAGALTDYLENKLVDYLLRGQTFTPPDTLYVGLLTGACSDSSAGTEVTGGSYARVAVTPSMTNFAGTQSSGSTSTSSGSGGTTSNNVALTFPAPTADWGSISGWGLYDASSGGNQWICATLAITKTVNNGDAPPSFSVGSLSVQIDN